MRRRTLPGDPMRRPSSRKIVLLLVCVGAGLGVYVYQRSDVEAFPEPESDPNAAVPPIDRTRNYQLADAFIRWYESHYVAEMQELDGTETDIGESVKAIGADETAKRYARLRRTDLDYAMKHPDATPVPEPDLEEIARAKHQHVLANTRSSRRWIDYKNKKLEAGIVASYKKESRAWVAFYRRLLSAPTPPETADFKEHIRSNLPRAEYAQTVEQSLVGTAEFYGSLKHGVAWYAPWAPWVKKTLDQACERDSELWRQTVDDIYGASPTPSTQNHDPAKQTG